MATETYELRIESVLQQERQEMVLHFQSDNVTANDTYDNGGSLIDSWHTNCRALFRALMPQDWYLDRLAARRVTKPSVVRHKQYQFQSENGTWGDTSAQTNQLCPSVFLVPPMGTKSGGRMFLPCVGTTAVVDNTFDAAYVASLNAWMSVQTVNFGVSGVHWQQVIYSRTHGTSVHVLAWQFSTRIGYQSRRRSPV